MTMTIGGYRVIRQLGAGENAIVWLGRSLDDDGEQVAIKVPRSLDAARAFREIDVLDRAAGQHVVRLRDVATDERGIPIAIMERVTGRSLADLLTRRSVLDGSQARGWVTSIARTIDRLHSEGITHRGLRADAIMIDDAGAPVLCGFGSAVSSGTTTSRAVRDADPAANADIVALRAIACSILDASGDRDLGELVRAIPASSDFAAAVASRMDEVPERHPDPSAIAPHPHREFREDASQGATTTPMRRRADVREQVRRRDAVRQRGRRRATPTSLSERVRSRAGVAWLTLRQQSAAVRPRFWVLAGSMLVVLVAVLSLVPGQGSDASGPDRGLEATSGPVVADAEPERVEAESVEAESIGAESVELERIAAEHVAVERIEAESIEGAARRLLAARDECLRAASVECVERVTQAESAARTTDMAHVLQHESASGQTTESGYDLSTISVSDEFGGAALIRLARHNGQPASVLIMRTEAGWQIRNYLEG